MSLDQLRVTLMALLPADGQPIGAAQLAFLAAASVLDVRDALVPEVRAGAVRYHVGADGYSAVKRGDAL